MRKKIWCFLFALLSATGVSAGKYFDFSTRATAAYHKVFTLRFEEAGAALDELLLQEPDNLIGVFLENYLEVLRIGIDDDEAAYNRLSGHMDARLYQLSKGEPRSPFYRYTQAEVRLQWALLRARFGDYLACLSDIKLAFALLEENDRRFPDFVANKKSLGMLHAMVGNVPDDYRWAVQLLGGMNGTIGQGLAEVETVIAYAKNNEFLFEEESRMAYALLQLYLNNQGEKAWNALKSANITPKKNPLSAFALATVALRTGRAGEAIKILGEIPAGGVYSPFPYKDFLLGVAKLYRLDADANQSLLAFINQIKGRNGVKEAFQKLAWHALLQGNIAGYHHFMEQVKRQGVSRSDPDKVALREAVSGEIPDVRLLKARLLFDGGYYSRAFDLLKNNDADYTTDTRKHLEYQYRMGRIAHQLGQFPEACRYYENTVIAGEKAPWYFACNAALQLGVLHEEKTDFKTARSWYRKCLAINPEEYAGSLHARAKAGLNRIGR